MARSNLYVVHIRSKLDGSIDGFHFFYNRRSAVVFIKKFEDVCFVDLITYYPDFSGMYHT